MRYSVGALVFILDILHFYPILCLQALQIIASVQLALSITTIDLAIVRKTWDKYEYLAEVTSVSEL